MKLSTKRIVSLLISVLLIIGVTVCFSSCASVKELVDGAIDGIDGIMDGFNGDGADTPPPVIDDSQGKDDPEKPDDSKNENAGNESGDGENADGDGNTDAGGEVTPPKEEVEFYPGQGSVPVENISAKNRTLLSTVVIISKFGLSPSAGSGVIYDIDKETGDAYIITNYHVVYNRNYGVCDSATLYLYGMNYSDYGITAKVLGGSVTYDIAVLKVEGSEVLKNSYAIAATFGDSEGVRVFDEVFAVGNPEAFGMAVTEGIISVDSESLDMTGADGTAITLRVMRVSAAINEGNSGGGIYDDEGLLIGIVCAKRIGSEIDNMAYAIPSNLAKNLVENIIYYCDGNAKTTVQRPFIGITITAKVTGLVADAETGELYKAELVEITELSDTCIAKDVVKIGDRVNSITVDGVTVNVTRLHHIIDHMLTAREGSVVVMNVTRGGESLDVTFTVPQSAFTSVN